MRKLYLLSILLSAFALAFPVKVIPQGQSLTFPVSLEWQPTKVLFPGHSLLHFEGAVNHDSLGFLPVYQYDLQISDTMKVSHVGISDAVYEPVEIDDPLNFPDIELIGTEPIVILSASLIRKIPRQYLYLLPLRKARGREGFEKLVSFRLNIDFIENEIPETNRNNASGSFAEHSVLRTGDWYRFAVRETGIFKIAYEDLDEMGIDPGQVDPRNIRLYGNGSGMLDEANAGARIDDLMENSIYIAGEQDGSFDQQDYILFYGESPVTVKYNPFYWQYEHEVNFYTDETYYFLTTGNGPGKRVTPTGQWTDEPTHEVYTFQDFAFHEKEEVNLIKSGKVWYGEVFNTQLEYIFPFKLEGIDLSEPLYLKTNLAGRSTTKTVINVSAEGILLDELDVPSVVLGSQIYARSITSNYELFYAEDDLVEVEISFVKPGSIDAAWMNYIELNYIRHLDFKGGQLSFRDMRPVGAGHVARYHIQTNTTGVNIWEVSDPANITAPFITNETGGISIKEPAVIQREYIAFDGTQFFEPVFIEKVENQDLHSLQPVDYIIVVHPMFLDQAHRLADHHRQYNGMSVQIVTPQQIYNEFSSGAQDISAIRDFMKMLYDRAETGEEPRYMLLFGDASYDYKDIMLEDNNLVPTYESRESLKSAASFVTDDFFGCLDEDEGSNASGTMDIGIGRFPVHTVEQAEAMVNKTINYMVPAREKFGPWRNSVAFIGR